MILPSVTLEEGDAVWLTRTAVSDGLSCSISRPAHLGGIGGAGGRAGRGGFLSPLPVTLTLEEGDGERSKKATLLDEGCESVEAGFESL